MRYVAVVAALLLVAAAIFGCSVSTEGGNPIHNTAITGTTWCDTPDRITVIGDSGSANYQPATAPTSELVASGGYWNQRLAATLLAQRGTQTVVHANSGAQTHDYLPGGLYPHDLDNLTAEQPSLVIVELGGNSWHSAQRSSVQHRADLQALNDKILAASPLSTILWVSIWELQDVGLSNEAWYAYKRSIFETAAANQDPFLDLGVYFPSTGAADPYHLVSSADHVHLTGAGHNLMYAAVHLTVNRICGWS